MNGTIQKILHGDHETEQFAQEVLTMLSSKIGKKTILLELEGELGAGKTSFTKFLGKQLGIEQLMISPTFVISRDYALPGGEKLYHIDAYRFEDVSEMQPLHVDEMISGPNIIVVEWPERIRKELREKCKDCVIFSIKFDHRSLESRSVTLNVIQE